MAYTDASEVRKVLHPTADQTDTGTAASLSDAQLGEAIEEADQEVDGALGSLYATPFSPTPPLLARVSRDIAAFLATLTHRKGSPIDRDDPVRLRHDRAQQILGQARAGQFDVSDVAPVDTERESAVVNPLYGDTSLFSLSDFGLGVGVPGGQL